ncbi:hypothetical protein [Trichococcus collinsii]|uniref:Uncharacterized protein n=1 Tax=Trichococcus collinsii TaxID=157076 RepID=A0AB37ZXS6_9LACT|nr:hypothetical protein [Trichococcus collinsii]CZR03624.1 Hypothetical protein Tcol_2179 [Trichococcus collinsii]SEA00639.1 hypothetical protein SAMN04488525_101848 [Trichococcus collinsii]
MRETVNEKEKAVLDAMRMGANVNILLTTDSLEKVDDYLDCFDGLKSDRTEVHDRSEFVYPYIGFVKRCYDIDLTVQASLMLKGGEKNEEI